MVFSANIDYKGLSKAFEKMPLIAAKELRFEMKKSTKALAIDAKNNHRFKSDSNRLENSIVDKVDESGLSGIVFLDENIASYGKYQHDGAKPHVIRPKNKGALFFLKGGQKFFVPKHARGEGGYLTEYWRDRKNEGAVVVAKGYVNHPGIKPDKFLNKALKRQEPFFYARISGAVKRILIAAGLK